MSTLYQSNIYPNALQGISEGVKACSDIVGKTMGAKGTNVIIEKDEYPGSITTNDGATIIEHLAFSDPLHKRGHSFVKEVTDRSNKNAGDGSTTTVILLNAILEGGIKSGVNTLDIKESLDACLPLIEQSIDEQTKQITVDDVEPVARIAGESDELASILKGIYGAIGKDGIIHLEGSNTFDTSYATIDGVRFSGTGYLSPFMVHDEDAKKRGVKETKAVYENPLVLVTKAKITHQNDINPLLAKMNQAGKKDLVIFTDDMDSGVARMLVALHTSGVMNILIIKAPVLWKQYVFEDFAKITGSTIIEDASGINFKNWTLNHLGTCGRIVVDKEETVVTGISDISDHIRELKEIAESGNDANNDSARRLSWLQTKTAILKLGAKSESELSYKRLKCEDAISAVRHALHSGIVPGGGITLLNASHRMNADTVGAMILEKALKVPFYQILENAGIVPGSKGISGSQGVDVKTGEIVDMLEAGIVDSATVCKNAVRNAIGVASTILTATAFIGIPPKSSEQIAAEALQGKGLRF